MIENIEYRISNKEPQNDEGFTSSGRTGRVVTVEENTLTGGFGSRVADLLQSSDAADVRIICLGLPDKFIEHGTQASLRSRYGLDAEGIARQVHSLFATLDGAKATADY